MTNQLRIMIGDTAASYAPSFCAAGFGTIVLNQSADVLLSIAQQLQPDAVLLTASAPDIQYISAEILKCTSAKVFVICKHEGQFFRNMLERTGCICMTHSEDCAEIAEGIARFFRQAPRRISDAAAELNASKLLRKYGIPAHLRGYFYLQRALVMILTGSFDYMNHSVSELYRMIGEQLYVSPGSVERAIRDALSQGEKADFNGMLAEENPHFTNATFIHYAAEELRMQLLLCAG